MFNKERSSGKGKGTNRSTTGRAKAPGEKRKRIAASGNSSDKPKRTGGRSKSEGDYDRPERSYRSEGDQKSDRPRKSGDSYDKPRSFDKGKDRTYSDKPRSERSFGSRPEGDSRKRFDGDREDKPRSGPKGRAGSYGDRSFGSRPEGDSRKRFDGDREDKPRSGPKGRAGSYGERSFGSKPEGDSRKRFDGDREDKPRFSDKRRSSDDRPAGNRRLDDRSFGAKPAGGYRKRFDEEEARPVDRKEYGTVKKGFSKGKASPVAKPNKDGLIRLNKYLADAGIASRRKADELIIAGEVTVNGTIITELGYKVSRTDEVRFNGRPLRREKLVYVLLNKPKDYITTTDDPQERRTVMELVSSASKERIYPVGRLDRNTTGLLLMTNDGELAQKLSHPKHEVRKLYHVTLDKMLKKADFEKIMNGLELEDGPVQVDDLAYVAGATKKEVGIELHSGKNRIVRRIFESLGYEVLKLDRSIYAGLTKKDLPRGRWRYLDEEEINRLKYYSKL